MVEAIFDLPRTDSKADSKEQMAICYPDTRWEDIPDSVKKKSAEENLPMTEVYGQYLSRREEIRKAADAALIRAMEQSPGLPRGAVGERLYSIEEMRAMPPKEVRSRYGSLLASLRRGFEKW
jgi:hypothetical protein